MLYYIHDAEDCFKKVAVYEDAVKYAATLICRQFRGVHIVYLTEAQHDEYCTHGNAQQALTLSNNNMSQNKAA